MRAKSQMKDVPALLLCVLSVRAPALFARVFDRVVDDPKMLRTVGRDPSPADVLKMVHPRPANDTRRALYGYLIGRDVPDERLPELVRAWERYKQGDRAVVPDVPFQTLASLALDRWAWCEIARHASWQTVRMNLATFARHGVFDVPGMADPAAIARARVLPYQLLIAYRTAVRASRRWCARRRRTRWRRALGNVPSATARSSSARTFRARWRRRSPVTARARRPRSAASTSPRWSRRRWCARTPLRLLEREQAKAELVVYVSDNPSWMDTRAQARTTGTETMRRWGAFEQRNPRARLVCIDLQPYAHTQAYDRDDVLDIGGFSDQLFELLSTFARGEMDARHWLDVISRIER